MLPYLAEFKTNDFPDYPGYCAHLLDNEQATNPFWFAISDTGPTETLNRNLTERSHAPVSFTE